MSEKKMTNQEIINKIKDLKNELNQRQQELELENLKKEHRRNTFGFQNIDLLLEYFKDHENVNCNDVNKINKRHCPRCILLEMKDRGFWDDDFILEITIKKFDFRNYAEKLRRLPDLSKGE